MPYNTLADAVLALHFAVVVFVAAAWWRYPPRRGAAKPATEAPHGVLR